MDIFGKLRVLFWLCVLGIWGMFMYQYVNEDLKPVRKFPVMANPFGDARRTGRPELKADVPARRQRASTNRASKKKRGMLKPLSGGLHIKAVPSGPGHASNRPFSGGAQSGKGTPAAPPGFATLETRHFVIFEEGAKVSEELGRTLESIHGRIMLDLVAFSPWRRDRKVFVYFAANRKTYQRLTGRPDWSGGASSLSERKIYLFKSAEAFGIFTHELTHIYFDGFFAPERESPLWLSEGVATYMQSERGLSSPAWLRHNLELLEKGGGFKLDDLMRIENLRDADADSVRLWYAQCYSVVRFLMRMKAGEAFYLFCKKLRSGTPAHRALYQAYGMPYNKLSALEYAWRYDLKTGKISGATPRNR